MDEAPFPKKHDIEVEFFSRKSTKTFQLINSTDQKNAFDAKRQWYSYEFSQPVYIIEVTVTATGYEDWNEIDFEIDHIDGTQNQQSVKFKNGTALIQVGKLSKAFRFMPREKILSSPKLQKVSVIGFTLDEFHAFEWALKEYEKRSGDLQSREARLKAAEDIDKQKQEQRTSLDSELGKSRAESEKLKLQMESSQSELQNFNELIAKLKDEVRNLEESRSSLNRSVASSKSELLMLKNEIRLFPSEIAGFVREGNRSIKVYLGMSIPFILVIFFVLKALFFWGNRSNAIMETTRRR